MGNYNIEAFKNALIIEINYSVITNTLQTYFYLTWMSYLALWSSLHPLPPAAPSLLRAQHNPPGGIYWNSSPEVEGVNLDQPSANNHMLDWKNKTKTKTKKNQQSTATKQCLKSDFQSPTHPSCTVQEPWLAFGQFSTNAHLNHTTLETQMAIFYMYILKNILGLSRTNLQWNHKVIMGNCKEMWLQNQVQKG